MAAMNTFEQFEAARETQAEARRIVISWLASINEAEALGQRLALLGYAKQGMDIALAARQLQDSPPRDYLTLLSQ